MKSKYNYRNFGLGILLILLSFPVHASTVVEDAMGIMEAICTNKNLYKQASKELRFATDAEGNFIIKAIGKVAASLGFEYRSKDQSGVSNTLKQEDLATLIDKQAECNKEFIPFMMNVLSQSAQRSPKAVAIDSKSYPNQNGLSNAEAIAKIIRESGHKNVEVFDIMPRDPSDWDPALVRALNPEMIFLHWSAFETKKEQCSIDRTDSAPGLECNKRFFKHFTQLAKQTDAQFVIYTRTDSACQNVKSMISKAVSRKLLNEHHINRAVLLQMAGSRKTTAAERMGSFASEQSKIDISNLFDLLLKTDGVSKIASEYSPEKHGICRLL